jgi:predicted ABC-type ATPase
MSRRVPALGTLLTKASAATEKPLSFVLAGHNGSGKSTLWYERLGATTKMPLVNADRLTMSILPERPLPKWPQDLRDNDERWQLLSQEGVRVFRELIMAKRMPFAFETVFSHWRQLADGSFESKASDIRAMQAAGYYVVLLFVGLVFRRDFISAGAIQARCHARPWRAPRTQAAIAHAAPLADMTIMFDNSREVDKAFSLVRAQTKKKVLFDARDAEFKVDQELRTVSTLWLDKVAPS